MNLFSKHLRIIFHLFFVCVVFLLISSCGSTSSGGYSAQDEINKIFEDYQKQLDEKLENADKNFEQQATTLLQDRSAENIRGDKAFVLSENASSENSDLLYFKFLEIEESDNTIYLVYAYQAKFNSNKNMCVSEVVKYDINSFSLITIYSNVQSMTNSYRFAANVSHVYDGELTDNHIYDIIDNYLVYKIDSSGNTLARLDITEKLLMARDYYNKSGTKLYLNDFSITNFTLDDNGNVFIYLAIDSSVTVPVIDTKNYDFDPNNVDIPDDSDFEDEDISDEEGEEKYGDEVEPIRSDGQRYDGVTNDLLVSFYTVTKSEIDLYFDVNGNGSSGKKKKSNTYSYNFNNLSYDGLENVYKNNNTSNSGNRDYDDSSILYEYQDILLYDMEKGFFSLFVTDDEQQWDDKYDAYKYAGNNVLITIEKYSGTFFQNNTFGYTKFDKANSYTNVELRFKNNDFKPHMYGEDDDDFYENDLSYYTKTIQNVKTDSKIGITVNNDDSYDFVEVKDNNAINVRRVYSDKSENSDLSFNCSLDLSKLYKLTETSKYNDLAYNSRFDDVEVYSSDEFDLDDVSLSTDYVVEPIGVTVLSDKKILISSLKLGTVMYDIDKSIYYQVADYPSYKAYKIDDSKYLFIGYKTDSLNSSPDIAFSNFFTLNINNGRINSQTLDRYVKNSKYLILNTLPQFNIESFAEIVGIEDLSSREVLNYFEDFNYELNRLKDSVRTLYSYLKINNEKLYDEILIKFITGDVTQITQLEADYLNVYMRERPESLDGLGVNAKAVDKRIKAKNYLKEECEIDEITFNNVLTETQDYIGYVKNILTDE